MTTLATILYWWLSITLHTIAFIAIFLLAHKALIFVHARELKTILRQYPPSYNNTIAQKDLDPKQGD